MHLAVGDMRPVERPARHRLRSIVERQRVVQRGRPHPVAQRRRRWCSSRCRDRSAAAAPRTAERQRQRVGVRVAAVLVAVRPAVDDQVDACRRARRSSRSRGSAPEQGEWADGARASSPAVEPSSQSASSGSALDLKLRPVHERGGDGEAVAQVVRLAAGHRRQRAAVIVADVRHAAAIVGEQARGGSQPRDRVFESSRPPASPVCRATISASA